MLCRRLGTWIGAVVAAAAFAADASALALLQSQSRACLGGACEFTPLDMGAGASTDILRTYTQTTGPNTYAFQARGEMTVFDYDHWAAEAEATGSANLAFTIPGGSGPGAVGGSEGHLLDSLVVTGASGAGTVRLVWHVTGSAG